MQQSHNFIAALFGVGLVVSTLSLPVSGQSNLTPTPTGDIKKEQANDALKKRQQRLVPRQEFTTATPTKLNKLVDLPGIPSYPGKVQFGHGQTLSTEQGSCIFQSFTVDDDPVQVGDWYSNALSSNDWKKMNGSKVSITASNKSGGRATVSVQRTSRGKIHGSAVSITYSTTNTPAR